MLKTTSSLKTIRLPKSLHAVKEPDGESIRRITIIGANGSGKTRFMDEMTELCGDNAFCMNVLSAFYPDKSESVRRGSIDALYRELMLAQSYLRADAVTQLDKVFYRLLADEMQNLLDIKTHLGRGGNPRRLPLSRLDKVSRHWERIFPANRIVRSDGRMMFSTGAGGDLIPLDKLSQGEKAVLYYLAGALFAMPGAVVFIDAPSLFIHPAIVNTLWDTIEALRPDCTFVYNSVDVDFVTGRAANACLWVKSYDSDSHAWDYDLLEKTPLSDELMVELAGNRRPVLFIEGDDRHSIDMRLYSLAFPDMKVRPLGSCNKVIETVRTFNDLNSMHHLQSMGIVDRDRRTDAEVEYLRQKKILVPDVAEVENIFLLPEVIRTMATRRGKNADKILSKVRANVLRQFRAHIDEQALQHTRHKIKRDVECRIDARFNCITAMETHLRQLVNKLQPRSHYNRLRNEFLRLAEADDYLGILRVFNHKPMLSNCNLHGMLGYKSPSDYIYGVLDMLKTDSNDATHVRNAILHILHADRQDAQEKNGQTQSNNTKTVP